MPLSTTSEQYARTKEALDGPDGIRRELHALENVHTIEIGPRVVDGRKTASLGIIVLVTDKIPEDDLPDEEIVPETVGAAGVETDVQQSAPMSAGLPEDSSDGVDDVDAADPSDGVEAHSTSTLGRRQRYRPAFGGVSGAHKDGTSGTIGAFVEWSGGVYGLTNRHVASTSAASTVGDDFWQPGPAYASSAATIGTVADLGVWQPDGTNHTDSALIDVPTAQATTHVAGLGAFGSSISPEFEQTYVNSGMMTGLTSSDLTGMDASAVVNFSWGQLYFEGCLTFAPVTAGGDSGSLWARYDESADRARPVGLHFAGSDTRSVAVPWSAVVADHGPITPASGASSNTPAQTQTQDHDELTPLSMTTDARKRLPVLCLSWGDPGDMGQRQYVIRRDAPDGQVVASRTVTPTWGESEVIRFDLSDLDAETYTLIPRTNQSNFFSYRIAVEEQTEWEFQGTVTDTSGEPLSGVSATITDGPSTTSDGDGRFSLWAEDGAKLRLSRSGYVSKTVELSLPETQSATVALEADETSSPDPTPTPTPSPAPTGRRAVSWRGTSEWNEASDRRGVISQASGPARISGGTLRLGYSQLEEANSPLEDAVAYWPLDEGAGEATVTGHRGGQTANSFEGAVSGATLGRAGPLSERAAFFDRSDSVRVSTIPALRFAGDYSISAVVRKTSTTNYQTVFRTGATEPGTVFLAMHSNQQLSFGHYNSAGNVQFSESFHTGTVGAGRWHHIVGTYSESGARLRVYRNGSGNMQTITTNGTRPATGATSQNDIGIGRRVASSDRGFIGSIAHVAWFDKTLSATEIDRLHDTLNEGYLVGREREAQS